MNHYLWGDKEPCVPLPQKNRLFSGTHGMSSRSFRIFIPNTSGLPTKSWSSTYKKGDPPQGDRPKGAFNRFFLSRLPAYIKPPGAATRQRGKLSPAHEISEAPPCWTVGEVFGSKNVVVINLKDMVSVSDYFRNGSQHLTNYVPLISI